MSHVDWTPALWLALVASDRVQRAMMQCAGKSSGRLHFTHTSHEQENARISSVQDPSRRHYESGWSDDNAPSMRLGTLIRDACGCVLKTR